jgi:hypothetical protein
LAMI